MPTARFNGSLFTVDQGSDYNVTTRGIKHYDTYRLWSLYRRGSPLKMLTIHHYPDDDDRRRGRIVLFLNNQYGHLADLGCCLELKNMPQRGMPYHVQGKRSLQFDTAYVLDMRQLDGHRNLICGGIHALGAEALPQYWHMRLKVGGVTIFSFTPAYGQHIMETSHGRTP